MAVMCTQPLTAVKRGNTRSPDTMDWSTPGSRTRNQHEGVLAHFRRHPAAWVCGNPFAADRPGQKYKCGFAVNYFDIEGHMCGFWVRPDGRIEGFSVDPDQMGPGAIAAAREEALAVVRQYGLFRGGE